jgi:hypothetical protein
MICWVQLRIRYSELAVDYFEDAFGDVDEDMAL